MCLDSGHSPSPVGRADCMCLHGRPCVWLPFAAACCYTLLMPAARQVCQRPSSNFPYFRTPLANFLLSRPNFVEYGNSKTTTLLHSAKCTRPLFQCRTGCGGRPSGWHDIVTCQRLVLFFLWPPYSPALVNGGSRKFRWTLSVVREVTTCIFSWSSLSYRVGQKVTKFGVFLDPTRKLSALTPERGRIL